MPESSFRTVHVRRLDARIRLIATVYGVLIFLWLSPEENQVWPVTVLGWGLSALVIGASLLRRIQGRTFPRLYIVLGAALSGALIGLGASFSVTLLMFFKDALHAHIFPDFPPGMMLAILARAPGWLVIGGLVGLGTVLIGFAVERK